MEWNSLMPVLLGISLAIGLPSLIGTWLLDAHISKFESEEDKRITHERFEPLSKLQDVRNQLKDLLGRMEGNDRLEELLAEVSTNDAVRDKLAGVLGSGGGAEAGGGGDESTDGETAPESGDAASDEGEGS